MREGSSLVPPRNIENMGGPGDEARRGGGETDKNERSGGKERAYLHTVNCCIIIAA